MKDINTQKAIDKGFTVLGIDLGSTRIKSVLIGEDHKPIVTGSYEWENKPEKFGIKLMDSSEIQTKLVKEHKVAFECRLVDTANTADHSIFIAEVVGLHVNPNKKHLYALDGYRSLGAV